MLLAQWRRGERAAFSPGPMPEHGPAVGWRPLPAGERALAVEGLRALLQQQDCLQELPVVATLFDAFAARALAAGEDAEDPARLGAEALVQEATLAAVVRLALKLHGCGPYGFSGFLCREPDACLAAERELVVMKVLEGRLALPSPWQWAKAVLSRAAALATAPLAAAPAEAARRREVASHAEAWATLLVELVGSRPGLPPSALALGACALGLVSGGAMAAEEVRPEGVPPEVWAASLMGRLEQRTQAREPPVLSAALLAQAADVAEDELRLQACHAAWELQVALTRAAAAQA